MAVESDEQTSALVATVPRTYSTVVVRNRLSITDPDIALIICQTILGLTFMFEAEVRDGVDPMGRAAIVCGDCFRRYGRGESKECPTCGTKANHYGSPGFMRTNSTFGMAGDDQLREVKTAKHLERWLLKYNLVETLLEAKLIALTLAQEFGELQKVLDNLVRPRIHSGFVTSEEEEVLFERWVGQLDKVCRQFTTDDSPEEQAS